MLHAILKLKLICIFCIVFLSLSLSSCYTVRVATHAQEGSEYVAVKANSYFWGLAQKPQTITTPMCDSLGANGMAIVEAKTNFGNALITVVTLGIWHPMTIQYKCSKPCAVRGTL
ncbi:MAG: Bor family protein [Chitinophagaceae bacterium]|jgi:uncharacterized protein YceK|nr:Bor family protein [Chitinophagaceae bacterium]